jgi:hypothetical protein
VSSIVAAWSPGVTWDFDDGGLVTAINYCAIKSPILHNGVPVTGLYSAMENVSSNGTICNLPYMIGDLGCECYIRHV